jgi:hypothetical protein
MSGLMHDQERMISSKINTNLIFGASRSGFYKAEEFCFLVGLGVPAFIHNFIVQCQLELSFSNVSGYLGFTPGNSPKEQGVPKITDLGCCLRAVISVAPRSSGVTPNNHMQSCTSSLKL